MTRGIVSLYNKNQIVNVEICQFSSAEKERLSSIMYTEEKEERMEERAQETKDIREFLPLSNSQQNIWNLEMAHPGTPINTICTVLRIDGNFHVEYLQECIRLCYEDYPVLRTRITLRDGEVCQYIDSHIPRSVPFLDFSRTNKKGADIWDVSVAREHITLLDSPLCQMILFKRAENTGGILTKVHHIIADAWSQTVVTNRIIHNYFHMLKGEAPKKEPMPDYALHIELENKYLVSKSFERDTVYWQAMLKDINPAAAKEHPYAQVSPVGIRRSFTVSNRMNRMIAGFCREKKVSPFAVFYMALAVYLRRIKGQEKFCIGVPTINRLNFKEKQMAGMFVNTLPFVNELDASISFQEFNEKLQTDWFQLLYHQRMPFSEIKKLAAQNHEGAAPDQLFGIVLSYQNGQIHHLQGAQVTLEGRWLYSGYQAEPLCIHLSSRDEDNRFQVDYDYQTQLFSEREITTLHQHLMDILHSALLHPKTPIKELSVISEEEEERLIFDFNKTDTWYPRKQNIADHLREQAVMNPGRAAVIFRDKRMTYEKLVREADTLAEKIACFCPEGGKNIAVLMERSDRLLVVMAAVAFSGNAWLLMDCRQPAARIRELLEDSGAALVISDGTAETADFPIPVFTEEELQKGDGAACACAGPDDLAYLVYTSGSTGKPKAVEVEQHSVLNLAAAMTPLYPKGAVLSICNVGFDAFLLESISALLNGRTIVMAEEAVCNMPSALAELICGYDAGFMALTPSRLLEYLKDAAFGKAMSHIECIVCGGESMPPELYHALRFCSSVQLYNQYGPSEATVAVSHSAVTGNEMISIGKPLGNCRIYILDESMRPLPVGAVGELYIGGDCLARGYHGDEELTKKKFVEDPYIPGERLYRTGDMGYWTQDGEIIFTGRKDGQLKILGHRMEPAEIEEKLVSHPKVNMAAVKAFDNLLVAYYTSEEQLKGDELLAYAAFYLPRYQVPAMAVQLQEMPVTANGKVDHKKLPKPVMPDIQEAPADELEEKLLEIWKKSLQQPNLSIHSDYFLNGGDSLNAVAMLTEVEREFSILPELTGLYACRTVRRFANLLRGREADASAFHTEIPKAPKDQTYPLTAAQRSFYVLEQTDVTKTGYHMPGIFLVEGNLDRVTLTCAFRRIIREDETFRTGFEITGSNVQARVHEQVDFELEEVTGENIKEAADRFIRPFQLDRPPLMRAGMFTDGEKQYLLLDIHHIISDGMSSQLVFERLHKACLQEETGMPDTTYRDYAWWVEKRPAELQKRQEGYWRTKLSENREELRLPTDRIRPGVFDGRGGRYYFHMPKEMEEAGKKFCAQQQVTPYMMLLSAFGILLFGVCGQEKIVVGTPVSGRRHGDLSGVTGVFVNTLPVFLEPERKKNYLEYLHQVRERVLEMLDNQDTPLEDIVAMSNAERNRDRNPLYQVLFSLTAAQTKNLPLGEAKLTMLQMEEVSVKMDLHLEVIQNGEESRFCFEYAKSLFDSVTIEFYSRCYLEILRQILELPHQEIGSINLLEPCDSIRLLEEPNYLRMPYDGTFIDRMIDRQACLYPTRTAVCWGNGKSYTFGELKDRSDGLAAYLISKGIRREDRVAFLLKRDGDMLAAMLGILKAGAAYLPVDPALPKERICYMLENAGAKLLLRSEEIKLQGEVPCPVLLPVFGGDKTKLPVKGRTGEDVLNVIYTSGTTGQPKGVMMVHKAVSNLAAHVDTILGNENSCVLCASNCVFDVFTIETLLALARGRHISVADEEEMLLPWKMAERMKRDGATVLQLTPSRMQMCLHEASFAEVLARTEVLILMGEPWTLALKERIRGLTNARIFNIYGPTETSVYNCQGDITEDNAIHIGKPIGNCRYYLLDQEMRQVMPTGMGEIYIAGECLAKGYINRDDLTEQAFLPDPFFPGERMYKTGDLGRLRADGNWQCLGRADAQIKLNGHRIEPEEIEAQILQSGFAKEAAVVPVRREETVFSLCAFLVPKGDFSEDSVRACLAKKLPDYMVPGQVKSIDRLPRTSSGKVDRKELERNVLLLGGDEETVQEKEDRRQEEVISEKPQEGSEADKTPLDIWREVLGKEPEADKSFFMQGGTSLTAIVVLSHYYSRHWDFSLNDFYRHPTLREQMQMIGEIKEDTSAQSQQPPKADREKVQSDVTEEQEERLPRYVCSLSEKVEVGENLLLTGATGYLGAHLLRELAADGEKTIYCLLRKNGEARLDKVLSFYFGKNGADRIKRQIRILEGDITLPELGISETLYHELSSTIDTVVHAAADVRHYAPMEELLLTNVEGTKNVLSFAEKGQALFIHISTVSVAGEFLKDAPGLSAVFSERDLDMGQNWEENPYVKSKILAETLVCRAMDRGLKAGIFRVGRLIGRKSDGVFQINPETNAFYRLVRGVLELDQMPKRFDQMLLEITPVDQCARAVCRLMGQPGGAWHIANPDEVTLADLLEECKKVECVPDQVFEESLRKKAAEDISPYIQAAAETYFSGRAQKTTIYVDARRTVCELKRVQFDWENTDLYQAVRCFKS